ncbi:ABC transporter permease [Clostridium sediminicola]|uniref:ABC transporter permease n=1 Tax=Clostridium sediminicola TaxID=3114879 RepID=UPI0031F2279E
MFSIFVTILKKEFTQIIRNRKFLFVTIIMPFILFPSIFWIGGKIVNERKPNYNNVIDVFVEDETKGYSSLTNYLKSIKKINVIQINNLKDERNKDGISLGLLIPKEFENEINLKGNPQVEIYYNINNEMSLLASYMLSSYIEKFSDDIIRNRLQSFGVSDNNFNKISIIKNSSSFKEDYSNRLLANILSVVIIILSVVAPMIAALDLGFREKERGTMAVLLTTQANRISVVFGKFIAMTSTAIITSVLAIEGLIFAIANRGGYIFDSSVLRFYMSNKAIGVVCIILILSIMLFAAIELILSICSKSIKEIKGYLFLLTLITFIPSLFMQLINTSTINEKYFHIPIVNIILLIKEVVLRGINTKHILMVIAWIMAYILVLITIAIHLLDKDEVSVRE